MTRDPFHQGQAVRLKPRRADAYGFSRDERYIIKRLYTKPGYVALWAELSGGSMVEPLNKVRLSELRPLYRA